MNSAQISLRTRRRCLWLFAALLPCALYGFLKEQQSWKPRTIQITPNRTTENITDVEWSPDGRNIGFLAGNTIGFVGIQSSLHQSRTLKEIHKLGQPLTSELDTDLEFAPDGKTLWFSAGLNSQPIEKTSFYNYEFVLATHQIKRHKRGSLLGWFGKSINTYLYSGPYKESAKGFINFPDIIGFTECPGGKTIKEVSLKAATSFRLPYDGGEITEPAFSPDKKMLGATLHTLRGSDKADFRYVDLGLYLFDANTGLLKKQLLDDDERDIDHIVFSPDSKILYCSVGEKASNSLRGWQVSDGKVIMDFPLDKYSNLVKVSPSGDLMVFYPNIHPEDSNGPNKIYLWNLTTKEMLVEFNNPDEVTSVQFSPASDYIAVGGKHGMVTTYRIK